jgi:hypothetical protein
MQEDKAAKESRLAELTAHCRDVQMLKFGQKIDVSMLDRIGLRNKTADDLREVLKGQVSWHHCDSVQRRTLNDLSGLCMHARQSCHSCVESILQLGAA